MNKVERAFCHAAVHPGFYLHSNPDVRASGIDPRAHFAETGVHEGRSPNPLFDEEWYRAANNLPQEQPAFLHYARQGLAVGSVPAPELSRLLALTGERFTPDAARTLFSSLPEGPAAALRTPELIRQLIAYFDPDQFAFLEEKSGHLVHGAIGVLSAYFERGLPNGVSFSRGFDVDYICARQGWSLSGPNRVLSALQLWLRTQCAPPREQWRVVASTSFDTDFYLAEYEDVARAKIDPYVHYLEWGLLENRRANDQLVVPLMSPLRPKLETRRTAYPQHSVDGFGASTLLEVTEASRAVRAEIFLEAYARAQALESGIQDLSETRELYLPPRHDAAHQLLDEIFGRLPKSPVRYVVVIPWVRMGGADFIASRLTHALAEITSPADVLVIKADDPDEERGAWFKGFNVLDLSDIFAAAGEDTAQNLLFQTLRFLAPTAVINVNSRLLWGVFERYGRRLSETCATYGYLFCWDETPSGRRVGYPDKVATCMHHLTGIFADSEFLIRELTQKHLLPAEARRKLFPLFTPPRPEGTATAGRPIPRGERPLVLWAGRYDRQKRIDILFDVARLMPDVDFYCWGKAVLGDFAVGEGVPANLLMFEPFHEYDELPLQQADCWLYTSDWDGTPTILIDLAMLRVPLVASNVGGIGDLLGEDGAWLVPREAQASEYAAAIREAVRQPDLGAQKASQAFERMRERHTWSRYVADVRAALEQAQ